MSDKVLNMLLLSLQKSVFCKKNLKKEVLLVHKSVFPKNLKKSLGIIPFLWSYFCISKCTWGSLHYVLLLSVQIYWSTILSNVSKTLIIKNIQKFSNKNISKNCFIKHMNKNCVNKKKKLLTKKCLSF